MPDPAPAANSAEITAVLDRLQEARERMVSLGPRAIAGIVADVVERWLVPGSVWMERAVDAVTLESRFSRPMVRGCLPRMIEPLRGDAVEELVRRELGGWDALADLRPPGLTLHVLPSNLPGHAAIPTVLSLVERSTVLVKPGRTDRSFTRLWIDSIRDADLDLGSCVESCYWRGGEREIERIALREADIVIASGGNRAIEELGGRCSAAFVGHGHRVSFALVCRGADRVAAARALAADVAVWDQLGCLSPQICFVEGDVVAAGEFAKEVAGEFGALARRLPPGDLASGEVLEVRRFRDAAEWRGYDGEGARMFAVSDDLGAGTIVVEDVLGFEPTPLHRCLRVVPVADVADVVSVISEQGTILEGAGVAAPAESADAVWERLRSAGVPHVVALGEMQRPTLAWRPGGRSRLVPSP